MTGKSTTREDLVEAVYQRAGLSRAESAAFVELVLRELCDALATRETVKLSSFGVFTVRQKGKRVGRNLKTNVEVPIEAHRVITFSASPVLKAHMNAGD